LNNANKRNIEIIPVLIFDSVSFNQNNVAPIANGSDDAGIALYLKVAKS
jgi:hypothetical protein